MLRAVLVDDEVLAITLLENLLKEFDRVEVVGKFTNAVEAIQAVSILRPDVIFLDIEMPTMNGLKLAEHLKRHQEIEVVFVTAYDHYALEAFDVYAAAYLLKPIAKDRLEKTIMQLMRRNNNILSRMESEKKIKAQLMGDFVLVDHQGQPIKWRTKKVKELCAYLLHHRDQVHRTKVIDDLWQDVPIEKAFSHLHSSMYQLRKEFKRCGYPDSIIFTNERYSLTLDIDCDVFYLQRMLERSIENEDQLKQMLALYKNNYLEFEDYSWAVNEKESIKKRFSLLLEEWIWKKDFGQDETFVHKQILEKLIELDPFEEKYSRALMEYHIFNGNDRKALEMYKNLEQLLKNELNLKPRAETKKIIQYLL